MAKPIQNFKVKNNNNNKKIKKKRIVIMVSKFVSKFESIMCHSKLKTGYLGMLNSHALGVLPYKNGSVLFLL